MIKRQAGFTLIELMIAVIIIGIIVSIALPSYRSNVQEAARSEAQDRLLGLMLRMESFRVENITFTEDLTDLGLTNPLILDNGFYSIAADNCTNDAGAEIPIAQCVELTATALNTQAEDGDLIYNSRGRQVRIDPDTGAEIPWND